MIPRELAGIIKEKESDSKAIIILGPRQSGETTLLKMLFESSRKKNTLAERR